MKIIIAIDDSPYSRNVLESILERSWPEHTQFKVLTVIEPLGIAPDDFAPSVLRDTPASIHAQRM